MTELFLHQQLLCLYNSVAKLWGKGQLYQPQITFPITVNNAYISVVTHLDNGENVATVKPFSARLLTNTGFFANVDNLSSAQLTEFSWLVIAS